jgi:hypothetical protein
MGGGGGEGGIRLFSVACLPMGFLLNDGPMFCVSIWSVLQACTPQDRGDRHRYRARLSKHTVTATRINGAQTRRLHTASLLFPSKVWILHTGSNHIYES